MNGISSSDFKSSMQMSIVDLTQIPDSEVGNVLENAIAVLEGPKFMNRDRPYTGQSHTDTGERGSQLVEGLTIRDLRDCYIRGFIKAHSYYVPGTLERMEPNATLSDEADKGEKAQLNGNDLYNLNVIGVDPLAIFQNFSCEIEKMMGIFPNITNKDDFQLSELFK